ncbi:MAG: S41 family peptidase [Tissierellia bacterium]|nr:S41 family peptidase [Tissierellia bacterium]
MKNKKFIILLIAAVILSSIISFKMGQNKSMAYNANDDENIVKKIKYIEEFIKTNYLRDITDEELTEGIYKGVVSALNDPYSEYMTVEEFDEFMQDTSGKFFGIGVYVHAAEDGFITVVSPIKNTPAYEAGILTGDKIIKVDGEVYTSDQLTEATSKIKGPKNTDVVLTIRRGEGEKQKEFDLTITRDEIEVITVELEKLDKDIAYVSISQFNEVTYNEFKEIIEKIKKDKYKGMVLDLRSNPGGLLSECTAVADELLGKGMIVYTERKGGVADDKYYSDEEMIDIPMVVLINGGSASASEILAGAIRDHNRGLLIGEKTFGKGVVQTIKTLPDGSGIKLTISEYFTPNGENIDGLGIEPDVEVKLNEDVKKIGFENLKEDNQLQEALKIIRQKIK